MNSFFKNISNVFIRICFNANSLSQSLHSTKWLFMSFNPILHGGTLFPPWSIITRQLSMDALNWRIFLDFVPFNIRKVLGRPFLEFFLKISKILAWTIFSDFVPKGGPFYARIKKSKKSNFFCSKFHLFCLNMNYTCSKLSFKVSDMPCNQVSSFLTDSDGLRGTFWPVKFWPPNFFM